jgi:spermidine dehydrogenase
VIGVSVAVASSGFRLLRALALKERFAREEEADDYPPPKTGMCGSHVGSFEVTNQLCDRGNWDLSTAADVGEHDDLMVLGGGISRLSAKHFFLKNMANAKMVILDMS